MRVLVLSNLYPPDVIGGYELGCRQVVDALQRRGHEVRVLTSVPREPVPEVGHVWRWLNQVDLMSHEMGLRSCPVTVDLWKAEATHFSAANTYTLMRAIEQFEPDVVYVWHLVGLGGLGLMACLKHLRVPWVWHLMDDVPVMLCRARSGLVPALAREVDRQLRGSFLVCSQRLVHEIEGAGIQLGPDLEILPNWVEGPRPAERAAFYRSGPLRVMYAGQIGEHKGVDLLITAAALLRERGYHDFSLDLYGNNSHPTLSNVVYRLGVEKHVVFQGSRTQTELAALYAEHDVFAFPTWAREPFGFAPLEAAARGCVPVISDLCGISEWFVHGLHCLKAERTAEAFATTLAAIMRGDIALEPIARRAANAVWRHFHIDALVPRIERALHRASLQSRAGAGTPEELYRMAVLAERLTQVLVQEPYR